MVLHVFNTSEFEKFMSRMHHISSGSVMLPAKCLFSFVVYHQRRNELQVKSVSQHQSVQTKYICTLD